MAMRGHWHLRWAVWCVLLLCGWAGPWHAAAAQALCNNKPIKLVVGFGAGGAMDTLARAVSAQLAQQGLTVYVENRLGAGGSIAAAAAVQAKPDGCTWLLASPAERFINRWFVPPVRGGDVQQLRPVAQIAHAPLVVAVRSDAPQQQLHEVLHTARSQARGLSFASSGVGSAHHLLGELLQQSAGGAWVHVPYNGGPAAAAGLLGGQVDVLVAGVAPVLPLLHSRKLRVLAVAAPQRVALLPEVPTLRELGLQGSELPYWQTIFVPPQTPDATVQAVAQAVETALQSPQLGQQLQVMGFVPALQTGAALQQLLAQEALRYQRVAQALGLACAGAVSVCVAQSR